jgi:hypothetical protein
MNLLDAVENVLQAHGEPLHYRDITSRLKRWSRTSFKQVISATRSATRRFGAEALVTDQL